VDDGELGNLPGRAAFRQVYMEHRSPFLKLSPYAIARHRSARASQVREKALGSCARRIDLGEHGMAGKERSGQRGRRRRGAES